MDPRSPRPGMGPTAAAVLGTGTALSDRRMGRTMTSPNDELHITIGHSPASDGWGFVGTVRIADHECYRSLRVFTTPTEALEATQVVMGDVLGALLAGQEWRALSDQVGHTPTRTDLRLGLANALTMPPVVGSLDHPGDSLDHADDPGESTHA